MPIYEYKCLNCNHRFEKLVLKKEKAACPRCQGQRLTKLFSTFAAPAGAKENLSPCQNRSPYCPEGPCSPETCPASEEGEE